MARRQSENDHQVERLDAPDIEPHELFMPEDDDDPIIGPPLMLFISITRLQPYLENGGRCFNASELPNVEAIGARFGKGKYRVQARDSRKKVLAWREFTIARGGPPLPMDGNGAPMEDEPQRPEPRERERPMMGSTNDVAITAMERLAATNAAQFQNMLVLVQEGGKQSLAQQAQFFENMMKLQNAAPPKPAAAESTSGASGDPAETFRNGMEFMQEMMESIIDKVQPPEKPRERDDDGKGTIGMVVEGIKALSEMQKSPGLPAAAAAAAALGEAAK